MIAGRFRRLPVEVLAEFYDGTNREDVLALADDQPRLLGELERLLDSSDAPCWFVRDVNDEFETWTFDAFTANFAPVAEWDMPLRRSLSRLAEARAGQHHPDGTVCPDCVAATVDVAILAVGADRHNR